MRVEARRIYGSSGSDVETKPYQPVNKHQNHWQGGHCGTTSLFSAINGDIGVHINALQIQRAADLNQ
jgi:hypothetical protein